MEKYDLPKIADVVQNVYEGMSKLTNDYKESIGVLRKTTSSLEKVHVPNIQSAEEVKLVEKLDLYVDEIKALMSAERLLHDSINEKDKSIASLMNEKERHINSINDMNTKCQLLQSQVDRYEDNSTIYKPQTSDSERELQLENQCQAQQTQIRVKQDLINTLSETNAKLQQNIHTYMYVSSKL